MKRERIDMSGVGDTWDGRRKSFPMRKIEKKKPAAERQNPPLIPSDPIAPGLDFDAFARRAGEIIARAARAARKGHRQPD